MANIGDILLAPEIGWQRFEETNSLVTLDGTFLLSTNSLYSGSSAQYNNINTNKVKFSFYGTKIRIINVVSTGWSNDVQIDIDGTVETYSQLYSDYGTTTQYQLLLYEKTGLTEGIHTVEITNPNNTNYWGFDCFEIDDTGYLVTSVGQQLTNPETGWQRIDQEDSKITMTNFRYYGSNANYWNSTYRHDNDADELISFTFYGTKLRIISAMNTTWTTSAQITIDGTIVETFNMQSSAEQYLYMVYEKIGLAEGEHTVEIINLNSGQWFGMDAIDIDDTGYLVTQVGQQLLNPETGWQRFDDTNSGIIYTGTWVHEAFTGWYNNTRSYSNDLAGNYTFKFYGTKLRIITETDDNRSLNVNINIDGISESFSEDSVSPIKQVLVYEKTGLTEGEHTVIVSLNTAGYFTIDAIDINDTGYLIAQESITINNTTLLFDDIIYVETTGNDTTGDGSIGNPFATIEKALDTVQDGEAIKIGDGDFAISNYATFINREKEYSIIGNGITTVVDVGANIGGQIVNTKRVKIYRMKMKPADDATTYFFSSADYSTVNFECHNVVFTHSDNGLYPGSTFNSSYFLYSGHDLSGKAHAYFYNCTFNVLGSSIAFGTYGRNIYHYNTATNATIVSNWATHSVNTTCVGDLELDSNNNITSDTSLWVDIGTGTDPDSSQADIGIAGGEFALDYIEPLVEIGDVLPDPQAGWVRYDNTNSYIIYTGSWTTGTSSLYYNNTYAFSTSSAAQINIKFYGTKFRIIGSKYTNGSTAINVNVDGTDYQYSALNTSQVNKVLHFDIQYLTEGEHEVIITNLQDGNPFDLDAIDIDDTGYLILPFATIGDYLPVPDDGWARFDQDDSKIMYNGTWTKDYYNASYYLTTLNYSNDAAGNINFKFNGTKLRLIAQPYSNRSTSINVTIDGVTETYSEYAAVIAYQILVYEKQGLTAGDHEVTISLNNAGYYTLDAIDIDDTGYLVDNWQYIDERDSHIKWYGSWLRGTDSNYYNTTWSYSTQSDPAYIFKFYGTRVRIITANNTQGATFTVNVDGVEYSADCIGSINYQLVLFELTNLPEGEHVLYAYKTGGTFFIADAFQIDDDGYMMDIGIGDSLPFPIDGYSRYDNTHEYIDYNGAWTVSSTHYAYYNDTYTWSNDVNGNIKFAFNGTDLRIIAGANSSGSANISISIDDNIETYSLYQASGETAQLFAYEKTGLAGGDHKVIITVSDGNTQALDAIDVNGSLIPWVLEVGDVVTEPDSGWQRFDNTESKIKYNGTWTSGSQATYYNSTYSYTLSLGITTEFKFYGTKLRIIGAQNTDRSTEVTVTIDGTPYTYNPYDSVLDWQILLFEQIGLAEGEHTVTIENTAGSGRYDIDAIDIDDTGYLIGIVGTQLPSPDPNWIRFDDRDGKIIYNGTFTLGSNAGHYNSTASWNNTITDNITFKFYGNKIRIIAPIDSTWSNSINITIDGVTEIYSEYNTSALLQMLVYEKLDIVEGIHEVTITNNNNGEYFGLDAIDLNLGGYLIPQLGTSLTTPETGWNRYDNTNELIEYDSGVWNTGTDAGYWTSTYTNTNRIDGFIKFHFYGTDLRIIDSIYNNKSNDIKITIDGTEYTFNEYYFDLKLQTLVFEIIGLEEKIHEVTISNPNNTNYWGLDAIDINDTGKLIAVSILHFNGTDGQTTIIDDTIHERTTTVSGDTQISSSQAVFGGTSLSLSNNSGFSITSGSQFDFRDRDFTVDMRIFPLSSALPTGNGFMTLFTKMGNNTNDGIFIGLGDDGSIQAWLSHTTSWDWITQATLAPAGSIGFDTWTMLSIQRKDTKLKVFINGIGGTELEIGTGAIFTEGLIDISLSDYGNTYYYTGYKEEVRIINGLAMYSGDYTVETTPYRISPYTQKFLLRDETNLKFYNIDSGVLTQVGTGTITENDLLTYGIDHLGLVTQAVLNQAENDNISVNYYIDDEFAADVNMTIIYVPNEGQLILPTGDLDISTILDIDSINLVSNESGSGIIKLIASTDSGTTWQTHNGTTWEIIDISNVDNVKNNGISTSALAALTSEQIMELIGTPGTIRFGYYLEISSSTDIAETDSITLTLDFPGDWKKAEHTVDYHYTYRNNILIVKLYTNGDFKINY